ncbi:MAG: Na+/H+ antiporter NhaC family protein, partial [Planctomycetes bacterium]|nr:Na+/H+ antiporter NhaC family protein [Planctomycetota bacterium]
ALFKGVIHPLLFPTILFLTACVVSFSTGSSWSTMSILLPNTVIFAVKMGEISDIGAIPMLVISIGAVLEGSIFGDHCSPISDTTILSSVSCAADHMDHIKTQAPYALTCMVLAIGFGYLPAAWGCHPAISICLGLAALLATLFIFGKKIPGNGD